MLFYLFTHSWVPAGMCPDQGSTLQPWPWGQRPTQLRHPARASLPLVEMWSSLGDRHFLESRGRGVSHSPLQGCLDILPWSCLTPSAWGQALGTPLTCLLLQYAVGGFHSCPRTPEAMTQWREPLTS